MAVPFSNYVCLLGGFFVGMFFMYNVIPLRMNQHHHRLQARQSTNSILQFGNPGPVVDQFERTAYTVSYNRKDRIPYWVGEHLTKASLQKGSGVDRDGSNFKTDSALPAIFQALTTDYTNSGYDRGHMAPAGDAVNTQAAMDETFLLSNIAPQVGEGFNRQYWAYFEAFCRNLAQTYDDVYVYTGPLFLPKSGSASSLNATTFALASVNLNAKGKIDSVHSAQKRATKQNYKMEYTVIGTNSPNVAVPTHFYKIILIPQGNSYVAGAFVLPNQAITKSTPLDQFQVAIDAIEKASGLTFFTKLDRSGFSDLCKAVKCVV
ncbi:Nuclease [Choanephora cucurbitarum]|uniref:Endonuclease n=1 Tax=Choanephora cucurbitarum TaxID=101091 RepID=A0A1C7NJ29_9FUNG|nr:Nuclease [Choanephora cucurbitarum]